MKIVQSSILLLGASWLPCLLTLPFTGKFKGYFFFGGGGIHDDDNIVNDMLIQSGMTYLLPVWFIYWAPVSGWLVYKRYRQPAGQSGLYDPTEIHSRCTFCLVVIV